MDKPRIVVAGKQLANVIYVWLRHAPGWVWGSEPSYERLKAQRRHDPANAPDPRQEVSELIAAEIERLNWQVSYEGREPYRDITGAGSGQEADDHAERDKG
jgi:hypothetical protein